MKTNQHQVKRKFCSFEVAQSSRLHKYLNRSANRKTAIKARASFSLTWLEANKKRLPP